MLELFYKLKSCIQKSDIDLKLNINFTETDFETVSATISALLPVFPRASKASNLNSFLGIVNQKGLWNQSTAVEERAREILHFKVSEVEVDEGKNSEKSMKKDMYKAICKQINYKVVGKQPQRAGDIIKCLKKEMSLFEDESVRGKYLQQVYDLLLTIRPTSVESERAFSAAGIILNKLRCRMDGKR